MLIVGKAEAQNKIVANIAKITSVFGRFDLSKLQDRFELEFFV